jgi:1-acyl-sn-glycerol-3-phosphate acyltransferase
MKEWELEPAHDLGLSLNERLLSLRREPGLIETIARFGWWTTVRTYFALAHRLSIEGSENIPAEPPFVMIANHASHLDALVMASALPRRMWDCVFPIAAGDVFFETPMLRAFAALVLNALPMWRKNCGSHALQQLRQRLTNESCAYILFPEGARSRDGQMLRFRAGLGMLVAGTNVPVVPCYLHGVFESLRPGRVFPVWRKMTVRIGAPIVFESAPPNREGWNAIAQSAERAVRELGR